jgi:long-subunit acyl-CoA synthetase (AMP-forming)
VVSRAAQIRKWFFIKDDFTIPGGEFTPTLKFKRKIILHRYNNEIEKVYNVPAV